MLRLRGDLGEKGAVRAALFCTGLGLLGTSRRRFEHLCQSEVDREITTGSSGDELARNGNKRFPRAVGRSEMAGEMREPGPRSLDTLTRANLSCYGVFLGDPRCRPVFKSTIR